MGEKFLNVKKIPQQVTHSSMQGKLLNWREISQREKILVATISRLFLILISHKLEKFKLSNFTIYNVYFED